MAISQDTLTPEALVERWREIIGRPEIIEARKHIETDAYGNIFIGPEPDFDHQRRGGRIERLLKSLSPGSGSVRQRAILTDAGIKVPDVIWLEPSRVREISGSKPITPAPEICVESD